MSAHLISRGSPANETSVSLASSVLLSLQCAFVGFHFSNYPGDFLFICPGFGLAPTIVGRPFFGTSPTRIVPTDVASIHINHILSNLDFLTDSTISIAQNVENVKSCCEIRDRICSRRLRVTLLP